MSGLGTTNTDEIVSIFGFIRYKRINSRYTEFRYVGWRIKFFGFIDIGVMRSWHNDYYERVVETPRPNVTWTEDDRRAWIDIGRLGFSLVWDAS